MGWPIRDSTDHEISIACFIQPSPLNIYYEESHTHLDAVTLFNRRMNKNVR